MLVNMYKLRENGGKILQGRAVTQTLLSGLTIHPLLVNFLLLCVCQNCENCLRVDCNNKRGSFWYHSVHNESFHEILLQTVAKNAVQ